VSGSTRDWAGIPISGKVGCSASKAASLIEDKKTALLDPPLPHELLLARCGLLNGKYKPPNNDVGKTIPNIEGVNRGGESNLEPIKNYQNEDRAKYSR
jgi:hypothetical protein